MTDGLYIVGEDFPRCSKSGTDHDEMFLVFYDPYILLEYTGHSLYSSGHMDPRFLPFFAMRVDSLYAWVSRWFVDVSSLRCSQYLSMCVYSSMPIGWQPSSPRTAAFVAFEWTPRAYFENAM